VAAAGAGAEPAPPLVLLYRTDQPQPAAAVAFTVGATCDSPATARRALSAAATRPAIVVHGAGVETASRVTAMTAEWFASVYHTRSAASCYDDDNDYDNDDDDEV